MPGPSFSDRWRSSPSSQIRSRFVLAVMLIGSRQLGLAILMHEGAHGCFSRNDRRNTLLSQWLCAYPIFADMRAYRRYHLSHHAHTQQDERSRPRAVGAVPDHTRELSAQVVARHYRTDRLSAAQGAAAVRARRSDWPLRQRARHFWQKLGPQLLVNALLLAGLSLAGIWWAYPLLWLLPLLTWNMVITRIRNIAEHAVVPDSDDPLRNTRTTKAEPARARLHRALLRQLSSRASSAVLCAVLQSAEGASRS